MNPINLLITVGQFPEDRLKQIKAVDPRIQVKQVPYSFSWEEHSARQRALSVEKAPPDAPVSPELKSALAEAEIVYGFDLPVHTRKMAPRLKWVQQVGAGMETLLCTDLMDGTVAITCNRGGVGYAIADYVWGGILYFTKLSGFFEMAKQKKWALSSNQDVRGKTLGIVGLGGNGMEVARRAPAFGVRVIALDIRPLGAVPGVEHIYAPKDLNKMLAECDLVVLTLALTRDTLKMFKRPQFEAMKPGAYFINVARGAIVDTDALVSALKEKRIAGALLDVQDYEPVPPTSPLWDVPNLHITPHSSGAVPYQSVSNFGVFMDNLNRYVKGEPLTNTVDVKLGF